MFLLLSKYVCWLLGKNKYRMAAHKHRPMCGYVRYLYLTYFTLLNVMFRNMLTKNVTILARYCYYSFFFFFQSTVAFSATHDLTVLISSCNKRPENTDSSACKCLILRIQQGFTKSKYNVHFEGRKKELAGRVVSFITLTLKG
jgi:hypothetical protein